MLKATKITTALILVSILSLTACSMFQTTKRYKMEIQVKCPDDEVIEKQIPEVMLA